LLALDPSPPTQDGRLLWGHQTGGRVFSSPAVDGDGNIYFGSQDNYLDALSPNGTLLFRFETAGEVDSSPAISPDTIAGGSITALYFGSKDKGLFRMWGFFD